ncbi:MAG: sodium:alanine symporter family protein [bacterium]
MQEMQEQILSLLQAANGVLWGPAMLVLLVGTGIYLTLRLRGVQFRLLPHALYLGLVQRKEGASEEGDITHFQALMTALSATVGTGNIAGVATALAAGGPGALFWMWMTGLFGMATKYAEAVLAVRYRRKDHKGFMCGGPMYYLSEGMRSRVLGILFAFFASVAAFGIGNMVQSNSVADSLDAVFHVPHAWTGVFLALLTAAVVLGGIRSIARVTSFLVPFMILFYVSAAIAVLFVTRGMLAEAFRLIFQHAFTPTAAAGGFAGATVQMSIRWGVARGVFSNESGLGSSPIAAAAARTRDPATQALVSMTQTFIDTIVVCSMTGLVILTTGVWESGQTGAQLTTTAFDRVLPGGAGGITVALSLALFAYSTVLGWCYYGEKSIEFLLGEGAVFPYRVAYCIFVAVGAVVKLDLVWLLADAMNALMAIPNLIGLLGLSGKILEETVRYEARLKMRRTGAD